MSNWMTADHWRVSKTREQKAGSPQTETAFTKAELNPLLKNNFLHPAVRNYNTQGQKNGTVCGGVYVSGIPPGIYLVCRAP